MLDINIMCMCAGGGRGLYYKRSGSGVMVWSGNHMVRGEGVNDFTTYLVVYTQHALVKQ